MFNRRLRNTGWLARRMSRQPPDDGARSPHPAKFDYAPGHFQQVWEKKRLPSPGVQNYAYETLALIPYTPVGDGIGISEQVESVHEQLYLYQTVVFQGIPLVAGQFNLQPLFDPNTGYTGLLPAHPIPASVFWNDPNAMPGPLPTNTPI